MRTLLGFVACLVCLGLGCSGPRVVSNRDAGPNDAGSIDGGASDGGAGDGSAGDGGARDGGVIDAGAIDAGTRDASIRDSGQDASTRDAGRDAGSPDTGPAVDAAFVDGGPLGTLIQCAPPIPPGASAGIVLSSNFWSGFRFEITAGGGHITRIGAQITPDASGTIFGALVRLTGPSDTPDSPAIVGSDVLGETVIPVPASGGVAVVATGALDVTVPPGWYAVVFGTGGHGGTVGGNFPSGGGSGCISSPGSSYPFTIRQSDGMFILQGAEPHFFVELAP